ncbi:unnamed protein product, partial [Brassica rapa]
WTCGLVDTNKRMCFVFCHHAHLSLVTLFDTSITTNIHYKCSIAFIFKS